MLAPSTIVRIGVDCDQEYELNFISSWIAEWSRAPAIPLRNACGAGLNPGGGENFFCLKCNHPEALCNIME